MGALRGIEMMCEREGERKGERGDRWGVSVCI